MRSQGLHPSRRFVLVHVIMQPLTLILESPIRFRNQTKQTLVYHITAEEPIEEPTRHVSFAVEPNASQFLPFYLGEKPFSLSIQCSLPSLQPSSSIPVASIPFCLHSRKKQPTVSLIMFQCSPTLSVLMAGDSHEWFCCCQRESRSGRVFHYQHQHAALADEHCGERCVRRDYVQHVDAPEHASHARELRH